MLELPAPVLRLYPRETVVAEKFQALVALGAFNTRMKDFYDLWALARDFDFDGTLLCQALKSTFERRQTPLPLEPPHGLTPAFTADRAKQTQWQAFIRKSALTEVDLGEEVARLASAFLLPPALATAREERFEQSWSAGGPWRPR